MKQERFGISEKILKIIAMITMLVDHIAIGFLYHYWDGQGADMIGWFTNGYILTYRIMRLIGRMAFPLYCFMLVEGFIHTHNIKKYIGRLAVLAVVSEVPFDMAIYHRINIHSNNVVWTLLLGLIAISVMYHISESGFKAIGDNVSMSVVNYYMAPVAACFIAYFCRTDYGFLGVACIVLMYIMNLERKMNPLISYVLVVVILAIGSSWTKIAALIGMIPIALYNGKRGESSELFRAFSYLFYPLHLGVIALIVRLCL